MTRHPAPDPCCRRRLSKIATADLRGLQQTLKGLQRSHAKTFWHLSQFLARLDDELLRRRA
jgi:hypothetical protein